MWTFERKVRYYETDRMGVVHQSNYMRILEDARMDWIDEHVMKYSDMEKMGIIIPAVSSLGNFKAFLRFDDHFTVSVKLVEYTGVRIKFVYEVKNIATGELCYDGYTTHCFTRDGDYKPIPIRRKFPEIHEKFMGCVEAE